GACEFGLVVLTFSSCSSYVFMFYVLFFFFQAEDGIRDFHVTGVQTCALPISVVSSSWRRAWTASSVRARRERSYSHSCGASMQRPYLRNTAAPALHHCIPSAAAAGRVAGAPGPGAPQCVPPQGRTGASDHKIDWKLSNN